MKYINENYLLVLLRLIDEYQAKSSETKVFLPESFKISGNHARRIMFRENTIFFNDLLDISQKFSVSILDITISEYGRKDIKKSLSNLTPEADKSDTKFIDTVTSKNGAITLSDLKEIVHILNKYRPASYDWCLDFVSFRIKIENNSYLDIKKYIHEYTSKFIADDLSGEGTNYLSYSYLKTTILLSLKKLKNKYGGNFIIGPPLIFDSSIFEPKEARFLEIILALEQEGLIKIEETTSLKYWDVCHTFCNFKIELCEKFDKTIAEDCTKKNLDDQTTSKKIKLFFSNNRGLSVDEQFKLKIDIVGGIKKIIKLFITAGYAESKKIKTFYKNDSNLNRAIKIFNNKMINSLKITDTVILHNRTVGGYVLDDRYEIMEIHD